MAFAALVAACAEGTAPDVSGDDSDDASGTEAGRPSLFGGAPGVSAGGRGSGGGNRAGGGSAGLPTLPDSGSGGEAGGGGPPSVPEVCTVEETSGAPFTVTLKANSNAPTQFPEGEASVTNGGDEAVELSALELHYYFESEYDPDETESLEVRIYHADVSGGLLYRTITALASGVVVRPSLGVPSADAYAAVRFASAAGSLEPGEKMTAQFQLRPPAGQDAFYARQDQTNDYSFGACSIRGAAWERLVLMHEGGVASGEPPPGLADGGAGGFAGSGAGGGGSDAAGAGGSAGGG